MTAHTQENIALADVEQELKRLWTSYDSTAKIRACLFTLIVYAEDPDRIDYLSHLIRLVHEKFPCRVIFVHANPKDQKNTLESSVSAEITKKGSTYLACDKITITAGGKTVERIPFLILPHLVPDLPIYLLWGQDPTTETNVLPQLEKFCTRLIFDSDCSANIAQFTQKILSRLSANCKTTIDLTWAKLRAWRDVISVAFDTPEKVFQLGQAREIHIYYHKEKEHTCSHAHFPALYFQAWLASCMKWKPLRQWSDNGRSYMNYTNGIQQCLITLVPEYDRNLPFGALTKVTISSHQEMTASIERLGSGRMVRLSSANLEQCQIPTILPLSGLDRNAMLLNEIFYKTSNNHYRKMLQVLAQLQIEPTT